MSDTVEFEGETFRVADQIGAMPLMRFAKVARTGVDANRMEALVAQYDLIEQCFDPADWERFQAHAEKVRASGDQLMEVVKQVFAVVAARPTGPRSGSSGGPRTTEPSSTGDSSSPDTASLRVIDRLNEQGRPDLALFVRRREESLTG